MLKFFIDRPVFSTVISIIIVTLGILGLISLPITQYPDIAPPTIQVSANYTGADADVVLNSVIVPIEEQINGVEDMTYMTSTATTTTRGTSSRIEIAWRRRSLPWTIDSSCSGGSKATGKRRSRRPSSIRMIRRRM